MMEDLVNMVGRVNPYRSTKNVERRLVKILEELGETSEAYLSVSSSNNYKAKAWLDYREEACDTLIVLIDVGLTPIADNFPAAALLPSSINIATLHTFESAEALMREMFTVSGAVSAAAQHFYDQDSMGFYGAINRGIQAAANLCFATIPEDADPEVINKRVHELFELKLAKWEKNMAMYRATDDGE